VWIEGRQHADGTVQAFLGIDADAGAASGQQIDPAAAREVAVMLCEATDELERCTGIAPPF
jgi:hypothetical protein